MALYAYDEEILVYAANAKEQKLYRCSHCNKSVKVRRGPRRVPHFYHLARSPSCRLYSKSQDHLLAQLAIQKILPSGEATLERPFLDLLRVADVVWEPQKIIFEIQCSLLSEKEAETRVRDYAKAGYQVTWILDDRLFNRRVLRPAEEWMRRHVSYYASIRAQEIPIFYDQFEVLQHKHRMKKGFRLKVQLHRPCRVPPITWPEERLPKQILRKAAATQLFFQGDLLHKAVLSFAIPSLAVSMHNLQIQEHVYATEAARSPRRRNRVTAAALELLGRILRYLLEKAEP